MSSRLSGTGTGVPFFVGGFYKLQLAFATGHNTDHAGEYTLDLIFVRRQIQGGLKPYRYVFSQC